MSRLLQLKLRLPNEHLRKFDLVQLQVGDVNCQSMKNTKSLQLQCGTFWVIHIHQNCITYIISKSLLQEMDV